MACTSPILLIKRSFCAWATRRLVDFYICSRKGCTWHGLSQEDMNDIRLEQSMEW